MYRGNIYLLAVQIFFSLHSFSLCRIPIVADLGEHVGLERHRFYSADGDPGWDPGDAGTPRIVFSDSNHRAVETVVRPRNVCFPFVVRPLPFAPSLEDWRRVEHFVRASRDDYSGFQSLLVWLEDVPVFWGNRWEQA